MKENPELTYCMIFLREAGSAKGLKGLGRHEFGRIPSVDEYICFNEEVNTEVVQVLYKVRQVVHTGWGSHAAEIYVIKADVLTDDFGQPIIPA